jgi:hypothetical protein
VVELPTPAKLLAVGSGILRAVVGSKFEAMGHILTFTELLFESSLNGGQDGKRVLAFGHSDIK